MPAIIGIHTYTNSVVSCLQETFELVYSGQPSQKMVATAVDRYIYIYICLHTVCFVAKTLTFFQLLHVSLDMRLQYPIYSSFVCEVFRFYYYWKL